MGFINFRGDNKDNLFICGGRRIYNLDLPNVGRTKEEYIKDVENLMDRRFQGTDSKTNPIFS